MSYLHHVRHRNLHKMDGTLGKVVAREPQRQDTNTNTNNRGNTRTNTNTRVSTEVTTAVAETTPSGLVSVIFVTATPDFTGEVAGYTTLTASAEEFTPQPSFTPVETQEEPSSSQFIPTPATSSASPVQTSDIATPSSDQGAQTSLPTPSTNTPEVVIDSSSAAASLTIPTAITSAVSSSTLLSSYVPFSRTSRSMSSMTPTATSTAEAAASTGGMSAGGKAGLAIGIILIIGLVAGGVLWVYWKKKGNRGWRKADDEKMGFGGAAPAAAMASNPQHKNPIVTESEKQDSSAPRLSLRPVTQFIPDLAGAKKRLSQGNPLNMMNKSAPGAGRSLTPNKPTGSAWERQVGGGSAANPFKDPVNPFGDQAKAAPPNVTVTPPMSDDGSSINSAGVAVGVAIGTAGAAMAAGAVRDSSGQPRNGAGGPPGAPIAAGGPPPGNVHRVQLDFKPSMEDELELSAGQLIRLLHEYDDGWALCLRLDRSQQGVAPRTCLSARPVKPRPANGPPRMGPNGRPMSPANGSPRTGPNGHPKSPPTGSPRMGPSGRMSPAPGRPMSPAGGPRPGSPAGNHGPPRPGTANSNHGPSRPGTSNSNRSLSPLGQGPHPTIPQKSNQMSPGQFNQAPRPLSPGPIARSPISQQPKRSQSPGPYGANTGPTPMTSNQRRRSNSASAVQARRNSPPGSSPLAREDPMPGWKPPKPQNDPKPMPGVAF